MLRCVVDAYAPNLVDVRRPVPEGFRNGVGRLSGGTREGETRVSRG
jgi:hypothetical protein